MIERPEILLVAWAPLVGSLIGCAAWRLPRGMSWIAGRSACDFCGAALGAADLVPVISFLCLGSRCRHCGERISAAWTIIELAALAAAAACAWLMPAPAAWPAAAAAWLLIFVAALFWAARGAPVRPIQDLPAGRCNAGSLDRGGGRPG